MADFEAVTLEAIFHQSRFLDADPVLPRVGNDEAGRRRPDVPGVAESEIPPLMDMAGGDQPDIGGLQRRDQPSPRRRWNEADRARGQFRILRRMEEDRLVQEQRDWFAAGAGKLGGEPVELLGLAGQP